MELQPFTQSRSSYSFLDFTIDLSAERLLRGTREVRLRPKSFQVLRYLVEHPGRLVTREELLQAVWGSVAVTDESVTKCIGDIRKVLEDESQAIIRTVPRRGFVFQADVRLVQPAAAPPPLVPPPEVVPPDTASGQERLLHEPQPLPPVQRRRRFSTERTTLIATVAAAAVVVGIGAWLLGGRQLSGRPPVYEAIAVLPFESLSAAADQQFLADGMTEALITNLGEASPLRVIARTSVNQYRGTQKPVHEIARELNVDLLVEGTVTQSGDRLRVTANLIQVAPEKHIWARSYERSVRDVLALQNEIAGAIAAEIHGNLTPRQQSRLASRRPVNPEAQIALWKARYFVHARRNRDSALKSVEYAEQAVQMEPDWAPAHAGLATSNITLGYLGGTLASQAMPRARAAAERAIALDEELAEAHNALASVLIGYYWDWAGAEREVRRAVSLNPSDADARQTLANYLAAVGRVEEAVAEIRLARELDPFSFLINRDVGRLLYFARRYDEALAELRQAGDMQPNSSVVDLWIAKCYLEKGLAAEAVDADLRVRGSRDGLDAQALDVLRASYAQNGLPGYLTKLKELIFPRLSSSNSGVYLLAEIEAHLGDKEEAFRLLENAYQKRAGFMAWILVDPSLDPLRSDPRFGALLRRMGLTP